jgi:hypothetical protein
MTKKLTLSLWLSSGLALLFLFWGQRTARAESLVFTDTIPVTNTNWSKTFIFPKFDPSLGILTSVEISNSGAVSGSIGYENFPGLSPISVSGEITADLAIVLPDDAILLASGQLITVNASADAFDGVIDFGGISGATVPYSGAIANSDSYTSAALLQSLTGSGNITLPVTARASFNASGASNIVIALRSTAGAVAQLRYNYVIPQVALEKLTNGAIADNPNDADVPTIKPGDPVMWTYLVTNTGPITIPLASVVVSDSHLGVTPTRVISSDVGGDQLLGLNETWVYTAAGTALTLTTPISNVTIVPGCNPGGQSAPGNRNTYRNIGTVAIPGSSVTDPSHYCNPAQPGIALLKLTNGFDANNPNGADVPQLTPGQRVTWTYIITNTGNVTFTQASVVVTDSQLGITPTLVISSDVGGDRLLSPRESWTYTATGTALTLTTPISNVTVVPGCNPTQSNAPGQRNTYRNIGTVNVPGASANDPSHYCNPPVPGINLEKTVYQGHSQGAGCATAGEKVEGTLSDTENDPKDKITYCFEITNTGETYLDSLVFSDTILSITSFDQLTFITKTLTGTLPVSTTGTVTGLVPGTLPLEVNGRLYFYYETKMSIVIDNNRPVTQSITGGVTSTLVNTAFVEANPVDDQGRDIPNLPNVKDNNTATIVLLKPTDLDDEPEASLDLRSYLPLIVR